MIFKSNIVDKPQKKEKTKNVLPGIIVTFHLSRGSCKALISCFKMFKGVNPSFFISTL